MKLHYLLALSLLLIAGCSSAILDSPPKNTGPVTIAIAHFDYHQTIRDPNGNQREFYHCEWDGTLDNEGDTVDITYTGDGTTMSGCAKIIGVKVLNHAKDSYEQKQDTENRAKTLLGQAGYYETTVIADSNDGYASRKNFKSCPAQWQGYRVKDRALVNGLICDDKIVVLDVMP